MSLDRTVQCPICGKPYKIYSMMVGDQSACGACVAEAERRASAPDTFEQLARRQRYFK